MALSDKCDKIKETRIYISDKMCHVCNIYFVVRAIVTVLLHHTKYTKYYY